MQVARIPTPMELDAFARLFRAEGKKRGVTDPQALYLLAGILGAENSAPRGFVNHNWGNVMATAGWVAAGKDYYERPHSDQAQPQRFRSYPTAEEGASKWWQTITGARHGRVITPAAAGDAEGVADALFRSAYIVPVKRQSEAEQRAAYATAIAGTARRFQRAGIFGALPEPPTPSGASVIPFRSSWAAWVVLAPIVGTFFF